LVFFRKLLVSNTAESLDSEVDAPFATALVHSALQAFFPSLKAFSSRNGEITNSDDHSPRAGKKRLLALHPLGSSGSGFCRQLAASRWIESLDDVCEFVFIDAMFPIEDNPTSNGTSLTQSYHWFDLFKTVKCFPEVDKSSWMLEQSLSQIFATIDNFGLCSGVLGFSQGAMLTSVLAAMANDLSQGRSRVGESDFEFCIVQVSGMQFWNRTICSVQDEIHHEHERRVLVPSLHIASRGDKIIPSVLSMRAGSLHFVNPTFIWHKHGHVMPRLSGQLRDEVRNFFLLRTQVQDEKNN
jgi:predicted esterase